MSTDERFARDPIDAPEFAGLDLLDRFDVAESSDGDDALLEALREQSSVRRPMAPAVQEDLRVRFRQALQLLGEDGI